MGKRKRTKLRACGRWGMWVCTGLLVTLVLFSTWFNVTGSLQPTSRGIARGHGNVFVAGGFVWSRVSVSYTVEPEVDLFELYRNGSIRMSWFVDHDTSRGWWKSSEVWRPIPRVHKSTLFGKTSRNIGFSLLYPALLMFGWSLWLIRGRWKLRRPIGCCRVCGYLLEGLSSDMCPECGEKYA